MQPSPPVGKYAGGGNHPHKEATMIVIGIILLLLGFLLGIHLLWVLGIIALIVGLVLLLLGYIGHPVGGRRWYW